MSLSDIDLLPDNVSIGDPDHVDHHVVIHTGLKELKTLAQATDASAVKLTGDQTIAGIKTFSSEVIVPAPTLDGHAATKKYVDDVNSTKESSIAAGTISQYYRGDKTWATLDKAAVGLGNVDNTADLDKPISNSSQLALDEKEPVITAGTTSQYYRGDKTWATLDKTAVGLSNVDNTSDVDKPLSTAVSTALIAKEDVIATGTTSQYYRGDKTWATLDKAAVGLGNVDNTADLDKPISTLTQAALDTKASDDAVVKLAGNQTIGGVKTFSTPPKFIGGAVVGQVWTATSTDGSGAWQNAGTPATEVDWDDVLNKPLTFAPTIGPLATDAAAGNHTHTKADVGLGNVDNTSDLDKPISDLTQAALDGKVSNSRLISTSSPLTGGGDLSADRTIGIESGGITSTYMSTALKKEPITYIQTLATRSVGLGELIDGVSIPYDITITSVKYRMGTADASGTTTVELRKNGVAVSGSSGTASTSPTAVTGSWSFVAGDILTVYITAVGTTPGKRLTADIVGVRA